MFQVDSERARQSTRALLVSVAVGRRDDPDAIDELKQLVVSADIVPAALLTVRRDRPDPTYFVGAGKVEELRTEAVTAAAGLVIFDVALSPAQQRNLEKTLGLWVLDRTALILYIFSQRAQSREGKLQVELAQLQHLSTRLVRGWSHLERQRGGLGKTGGPGEKQIEIDRRLIGVRVKRLRERLKQSEKQRRTRRRARSRNDVVSISLVGYTNAGKSTLFNALTQAGVYAADQLFATLDTTARKCRLGNGLNGSGGTQAVISDTVGFIRGLPHTLIEAFKSTLSETAEADLLLHVVDAASPARAEQMAEVQSVLREIGADQVPTIVVYNKIDIVGRAPAIERDSRDNIVAVSVSAQSGLGLELLRDSIVEFIERSAGGDDSPTNAKQDENVSSWPNAAAA
ncbi:MAG TPA: GTPase HflX [Burkholderiaceae bacterium]|nr:GTPase HflX [Burkholderiaceae bacterium]